MSSAVLRASIDAKAAADAAVRRLFQQWCDVTGCGEGYGLSGWGLCRGESEEEVLWVARYITDPRDGDTESYELPLLWLDLPAETLPPLMRAHYWAEERQEMRDARVRIESQIKALSLDLERLKAKQADLEAKIAGTPAPTPTTES